MWFSQMLQQKTLFITYAGNQLVYCWKSEVDEGNYLVRYLQICLRHLTVFLTNLCLQNFMCMDLALRH